MTFYINTKSNLPLVVLNIVVQFHKESIHFLHKPEKKVSSFGPLFLNSNFKLIPPRKKINPNLTLYDLNLMVRPPKMTVLQIVFFWHMKPNHQTPENLSLNNM